MKCRVWLTISIGLAAAYVFGFSAVTSAASPTVSIRPALQSLQPKVGETKTGFVVTINNDSDEKVIITPSASDFLAEGTTSAIRLRAQPDPRHGLAQQVIFAAKRIELGPKASMQLQVTVDLPANLAPGGHYTLLRYEVEKVGAHVTGRDVGVKQQLSTFVFLVAGGKSEYRMSLQNKLPRIAWISLPQSINGLFTNDGTIQSAPVGIVKINGPGGKNYASGQINPNGSLVLPDSTRLIQTPLTSTNRALLPGVYTVDTYYRPTQGAAIAHDQHKIIYIGRPVLLAIPVIALSVIWLVIHLKNRFTRRKAL